jgi:hypothetical protein
MKIDYVYPNVAALNRDGRGSLNQRWDCALQTGCQLIEVPAHFIKNPNEIEITGLANGSFLTQDAISDLYDNPTLPHGVQYILHSEYRSGPHLNWYDQDWVGNMVNMLILLSEYFGVPPIAVEIHPGGFLNSNDNLINGSRLLLKRYEVIFGHLPLILLENRTRQFISTGEELERFWETASKEGRDIIGQLGIVLDIQQLFTSVNEVEKDFLRHFNRIPDKAIKGLHIHTRRNNISHQAPTETDPIPWEAVFSRLRNLSHPLIINPEVLHHNQVLDTIRFCNNFFEID